jgi:hypothetical protein
VTGPEVTAAMKAEDVPKALVERMAAAICPNSRPEHKGVTYCIRCFKRAGEGLAAVLPEVRAQALRDLSAEMSAEYEARTAKAGAYGQMKIRAALLTGAGYARERADRLATTTQEPTTHDPRCISLTDSEFNDHCDCRTLAMIDDATKGPTT